MSHLPLIHIPGALYSVVNKCNNNEFLFDSYEKIEMYIRHLIDCKAVLGFTIYDIVCMSNHIHELFRVSQDVTISNILWRTKGLFSKKFNQSYGRSGHFWKNRSFYRIIENEAYAYNTMHYFHMNPVRAGLAKTPDQWPYSGYCFHILGEKDGLMGKLLDPLPDSVPREVNQNMLRAIAKSVNNASIRYIGSRNYRDRMRQSKVPV